MKENQKDEQTGRTTAQSSQEQQRNQDKGGRYDQNQTSKRESTPADVETEEEETTDTQRKEKTPVARQENREGGSSYNKNSETTQDKNQRQGNL